MLIVALPLFSGCRTFQNRKDMVSVEDLMSHEGCKLYSKVRQSLYDETLDPRERQRLVREFNQYKKHLMMQVIIAKVSGHKDKAQIFLDQLLDIDPLNLKAVQLKVELAVQTGNLSLAEKILKKQMTAHPDYSICDKLAYLYYIREEYDQAQVWTKKALELGAPPAQVNYHFGMIAEQKGRDQLARHYYKKALCREPGFPKAVNRLRALQLKPQPLTLLAQHEEAAQPIALSTGPSTVKASVPEAPHGPFEIVLGAQGLKTNLVKIKALMDNNLFAGLSGTAEHGRKKTMTARLSEKPVHQTDMAVGPPDIMTHVLESSTPAFIVKIHKGGRFAIMNKGRWDGIAAQQRFFLYRDAEYVGQLKVSRVSYDFATLLPVENLDMQAVKVGDQVLSVRNEKNLLSSF